jgi:hypothetical protein
MKYYAGIGSRETPIPTMTSIIHLSKFLSENNFILRSGGAPGADIAFQNGCTGKREIYLPWKGFNNVEGIIAPNIDNWNEAVKIAEKYHPAWNKLSEAAIKLMGRNTYQILGKDLKTPVDFVVCYTPDGKSSGGTGQAMRIAEDLGIPIYNIAFPHRYTKIYTKIKYS